MLCMIDGWNAREKKYKKGVFPVLERHFSSFCMQFRSFKYFETMFKSSGEGSVDHSRGYCLWIHMLATIQLTVL